MAAKTLTFLHTAEIHCATFTALRDEHAPCVALTQHVRTDWLTHAQIQGTTTSLMLEMETLINASIGPVICTCTTLGPAAETLGAIRIDRPMMEIAAQDSVHILVVFAIESTREPTLSLLGDCVQAAGTTPKITPLRLKALWPLFVDGQHNAFHQGVAQQVTNTIKMDTSITTIVLAQASMADAARYITAPDVQILTSPLAAFKFAIGQNN